MNWPYSDCQESYGAKLEVAAARLTDGSTPRMPNFAMDQHSPLFIAGAGANVLGCARTIWLDRQH
jgi:hypothetical protein